MMMRADIVSVHALYIKKESLSISMLRLGETFSEDARALHFAFGPLHALYHVSSVQSSETCARYFCPRRITRPATYY